MNHVYIKNKNGDYEIVKLSFYFSQIYEGVMDLVGKIKTPSALHLLFWILVNMKEDNLVILRKQEKKTFIRECASGGGSKYAISTVSKAVQILKDNDVLISKNIEGERLGTYAVNPIYFWRTGSQEERKEYIVNLLKFKKYKLEDEENRVRDKR